MTNNVNQNEGKIVEMNSSNPLAGKSPQDLQKERQNYVRNLKSILELKTLETDIEKQDALYWGYRLQKLNTMAQVLAAKEAGEQMEKEESEKQSKEAQDGTGQSGK